MLRAAKIVSDQKGMGVNSELFVDSPSVKYTKDHIISQYDYPMNIVQTSNESKFTVKPSSHHFTFKTERKVPRAGMLLVGWGGNNGSTVTASLLANSQHISWKTKSGIQRPNYFGSLTQATTIRIGSDSQGHNVHVPFNKVLPMVDPNDLIVGGWDISKANLADCMERAGVLHSDLQRRLAPKMKHLVPMPSVYYPDFIAANQEERADNVLLPGAPKQKHLEALRQNIRDFKAANKLEHCTVLWTANTERFVDVRAGLNDTADNMLRSIRDNHPEVSPSQIFAVASILEGCTYINGSPQNTLTEGIVELAKRHNVFIGGDDFKSGQTKMKSVLVDMLVSSGLKPESIVSYNHLGNNDGKNLQAPKTFRSKEISKSNVVDDMVASNKILFPNPEADKPDHAIVIKYIPFVGDSKRAMDEYTSRIFMNGLQTIVMHNTCEDSLLATPLILDLMILGELMTRIKYKTDDMDDFEGFHPILSILSWILKAPLVPKGTPVVNALFKQHRCITNILCAAHGIPSDTDMLLEHKTRLHEQLLAKL